MSYQLFWDGSLLGNEIAFDVETEVIEAKDHFPRIVLATAYDGITSCVLAPYQLAEFLIKHEHCHFIGHNVAFDFWVCQDYLLPEWGAVLWKAVSDNRVHDTMLLDQLIWLAKGKGEGGVGSEKFYRRSLDKVAKEYLNFSISKKDNLYRTTFSTLWDTPLDKWATEVDPGYFEYATTDTKVTFDCYQVMKKLAQDLQQPHLPPASDTKFSVYPDCQTRYGLLTEAIQVKASIALSKISKNGMLIDLARAAQLEAGIRQEVAEFLPYLEKHAPQLLKPYKKKEGYELTEKSGVPSLKTKELIVLFDNDVSKGLGLKEPPKSKGKESRTSTSVKSWAVFKDKKWSTTEEKNEFIRRWTNAQTLSKRLSFFEAIRDQKIHPEYNVLMRTGRVSAEKPNATQMPKAGNFRSCFVASPGHVLFIGDYSAIELCTLATICHFKYGKSVLLETLKTKDVHCHTASLIQNLSYEDFLALEQSDSERFKNDRQAAKACFSSDTELLTEHNGWVPISALYHERQAIAQYDPHSKDLTFTQPFAWVFNPESELLELEASYESQCVTPDHRLLLKSKMSGHSREDLAITYPDFEDGWLTVHGGFYQQLPDTYVDALTTRLSVMVQADGSFQGNNVRFGFSKTRKIVRCRELLKQANLDFREALSQDGTVTFFYVPKGDWYKLTADKHFMSWKDYHHSSFIEEVGKWDGCVKIKHAATYSNTSKNDVDVVQTILVTNGYKTNVTFVERNEPQHKDVYNLYWYVGDRKKNQEFARFNKQLAISTKLEGTRPSYCVSVPTSWVLTRRNGKVVVSGNCNFGVPGGLGANKLAEYALSNYGVVITPPEAEKFRQQLISKIYPELNDKTGYLRSTDLQSLARNLSLSPGVVYDYLQTNTHNIGATLYCLQQVLNGTANYAGTGKPYSAQFIDHLWRIVHDLVSMSPSDQARSYQKDVHNQSTSPKLRMKLFADTALTLTGRIRHGVGFTEARNTPFQGLASDGGKLALYELVKRSYKVIGFIHDEILVELPIATAEQQALEIEQIMVSSMQEVLNHCVPVSVKYKLSPHWTK